MKANAEEANKLRLAHARWRVEVAQGALIAHRHAGRAARTYRWKVADGRHTQHLESAQTHLRVLVTETGAATRDLRDPTRATLGGRLRWYLKRKLSKGGRSNPGDRTSHGVGEAGATSTKPS